MDTGVEHERTITASVELRVYDGGEQKEYMLVSEDESGDAHPLLQRIICNRLKDMGVESIAWSPKLGGYVFSYNGG